MSFNARESGSDTPEKEKSTAQKTWEDLMRKITFFKEDPLEKTWLGSELDVGIEPMLVGLWANGFETSSSCFGHIHAECDGRTSNRILLPFVLLDAGEGFRDQTPAREAKRDEIFHRLENLVGAFYQNREANSPSRLLAIRRGFGYALYDVFLGTVGTMDRAVQKLDKKDLESMLQSAQKEFDAFAEFLKHHFFKENS